MNLPVAWRSALPGLALGLLAVVYLYFATGAAMVEIWNRSETFAHAYLVPVISLWLVWRRRADLALLTPRPAPIWLLALLPIGLVWLLGDLAAVNAATQFAFTAMLALMVPLLLGNQVAARIAFPLGFLFFAVPFGDFLTPALMQYTADFTVSALRASGIPVYREGLQFVIPTGSWSVVQACSGIRYLMASVMVGTLFAYLNYRSYTKRWVFVGVSIVTPLVANWLRAYMIVMLGHLSGNKLAAGVDHLIYGWVFFGIIMLVMFLVGARWADPDEAPRALGGAVAPAPSLRYLLLAQLAALVVIAAPAALRTHALANGEQAAPRLVAPTLAGMVWRDGSLNSWTPGFENPAATLHGRYEREGQPTVGLFVGYYRGQDYKSKLVTSVNGFVNAEKGKDWALVSEGAIRTDVAGHPMAWRTGDLRGAAIQDADAGSGRSPRLLAWGVYWINGRPFVSDWQAKLYGAGMRLLGRGDDAAVVVIYTDKAPAGADEAALQAFVQQAWPALDTWLSGVRAQGQSGQR